MEKSRLESAISAYQVENSRLESAFAELNSTYQMENSRLESAIVELQRQFEDLYSRFAQANDQISQMSRQLHDKSVNLAEHEKCIVELTGRLRKQLCDTRKLSHLLDNVRDAAERLGDSRRWKLANPGTAIKAKLSRSKVSTGYGHLDRIVAAYSQWRASHLEIAKIDDEIKSLQFPDIPRVAPTDPENETIDTPNCDTANCAD
jgi:chromosome segregation ATPase